MGVVSHQVKLLYKRWIWNNEEGGTINTEREKLTLSTGNISPILNNDTSATVYHRDIQFALFD